jgi:hypothetical protein
MFQRMKRLVENKPRTFDLSKNVILVEDHMTASSDFGGGIPVQSLRGATTRAKPTGVRRSVQLGPEIDVVDPTLGVLFLCVALGSLLLCMLLITSHWNARMVATASKMSLSALPTENFEAYKPAGDIINS